MAPACRFLRKAALLFLAVFFLASHLLFAGSKPKAAFAPDLTARAAVIVDTKGHILYSKNAELRLPPASTTKLMTAALVLEILPLDRQVVVSKRAANAEPSKAGLAAGAVYSAKDLLVAVLVSSSNDATVALAEAAAGSEDRFVRLMNLQALAIGMHDTKFVNATGLPRRGYGQYSTALDLAKLMRHALRHRQIKEILGIVTTSIVGSDGRAISLRSHNKMLWRTPGLVKGKTGWTIASKHTFVGTNYASDKILFALLSSSKPWTDIERLTQFGLLLAGKKF